MPRGEGVGGGRRRSTKFASRGRMPAEFTAKVARLRAAACAAREATGASRRQPELVLKES
jgi:hypothetical protein